MATFIILATFTDQGIHNIKETTKRAQAFREMAKRHGAVVKDMYWTMGNYDVVATLEAPDAKAVTTVCLDLGAAGNVRTQTLAGFSAEEMDKMLGKLS